MLDICREYFILYVWKQKHFVQKRKKKNKTKLKEKKSIFFLHLLLKGLVWMLQV